jgi:hypothetical protein
MKFCDALILQAVTVRKTKKSAVLITHVSGAVVRSLSTGMGAERIRTVRQGSAARANADHGGASNFRKIHQEILLQGDTVPLKISMKITAF